MGVAAAAGLAVGVVLVGAAIIAVLEPWLIAGREAGPARAAEIARDRQPRQPDPWMYGAGPVLALIAVCWGGVVIPLGPGLIAADLGIGLFYFIVVVDIVVVGVALSGWGANTEDAVEACYRVVAQLVAYVIPLGLAIIGPIMMARSMSTVAIVEAQRDAGLWYVLAQPQGFVLYLITALMQSYRAPFAEPFAAGIEAGVLGAVGGWRALLWRVTLSGLLVLVSAMGAALFLGGWVEPHSFSLPELAERLPAQAPATSGALTSFAFFALLLGFAIKLPSVPVHNWLPDAHVEAPAEGSAVLAGLQLKMGGFGLIWVMVQTLPGQLRSHALLIVILGLASQIYGALAALGQHDFKRLVAFTSVNHMGYVLLGVGVWGWATDLDIQTLALSGAVVQMISHGLLTGGMFLAVGMISEQTQTREMSAYSGLFRRVPAYALVVAVLAVGSFGLPGMSGFVAEFQVVAAALAASPWIAAVALISIVLTTGLYLLVISRMLLGAATSELPGLERPPLRRLVSVGVLALSSIGLGILPGPLIAWIAATGRALSTGGG